MTGVKVSLKTGTGWFIWLSLLFSLFPRLLSIPYASGQLFIGFGSLIYLVGFFDRRHRPLTTVFAVALVNILAHSFQFSVLTTGYYMLGIVTTMTIIRADEKFWVYLGYCFFTITALSMVADYVNPNLIDAIILGERTIDQRSALGLDRPVGFFRESSELGLVVAAMTARFIVSRSAGLASLGLVILITSQSFLGLVLLVFLLLIYQKLSIGKVVILMAALFVLYLPRFEQMIAEVFFAPIDEWAYINLSVVKRILHPALGFISVLQTSDLASILFGVQTGTVRTILQSGWSHLKFSDLSAGFILNGLFNITLNFGFFGLAFYLYQLKAQMDSTARFMSVVLILCLGMPILHSVFLILPDLKERYA